MTRLQQSVLEIALGETRDREMDQKVDKGVDKEAYIYIWIRSI